MSTKARMLATLCFIVCTLFFLTPVRAQSANESNGETRTSYSNPNGEVDGFQQLPFELQYRIYPYNGVMMSYKVTSFWENVGNVWYKGQSYSYAAVPETKQLRISSVYITFTINGACVGKTFSKEASLDADHNFEVLFKMPADCDLTKCNVVGFEVTRVTYQNFDVVAKAIERLKNNASATSNLNSYQSSNTNNVSHPVSAERPAANTPGTATTPASGQVAANRIQQNQQAVAQQQQANNEQVTQSVNNFTTAVTGLLSGISEQKEADRRRAQAFNEETQNRINMLLPSANAGNADAMTEIGDYYWSMEVRDVRKPKEVDVPNALVWYKKAANAGNVKAMKGLGSAYFDFKDPGTAVYWYEKAAQTGDRDAMHATAVLYRKLKLNTQAEVWEAKLNAINKTELDVAIASKKMEDGRAAYYAKKYDVAYTNFKDCYALYPDDTACMVSLASTTYALNKYDESIIYFKRILTTNYSANAQVYKYLADCYLAKKDTTSTLSTLAEGTRRFPDFGALSTLELELMVGVGQVPGPGKIERAIANDPHSQYVYYNASLAYIKQKDFLATEDMVKKALAIDPDIGTANFTLGSLLLNKGVKFYNASNKVATSNPAEAATDRDSALVKFSLARDLYLRALKKDPKRTDIINNLETIYYNSGLIFLGKEDMENAGRSFKQALAIDPANVDANAQLGQVYNHIGILKLTEAQGMPDRSGKPYTDALNFAEAQLNISRPYLLKALEVNPGDDTANELLLQNYYYISKVYYFLKDKATTKMMLEKALPLDKKNEFNIPDALAFINNK